MNKLKRSKTKIKKSNKHNSTIMSEVGTNAEVCSSYHEIPGDQVHDASYISDQEADEKAIAIDEYNFGKTDEHVEKTNQKRDNEISQFIDEKLKK